MAPSSTSSEAPPPTQPAIIPNAQFDISKVYEFWLRPENYEDVPVSTAFEMYNLKLIDVTRFTYHTKQDQIVPNNLEEMCEFVVRKEFSSMIDKKQRHFNWYYFLEMCLLSQTSQKFLEQERAHTENLKRYKSLLEEMDMRSGGTQSIMWFFDAQQKMMRVDPEKALAMTPPIEWTSFVEYSARDKEIYRSTFTVEMSRLVFIKNYSEESARMEASKMAEMKIKSVIASRRYKKQYKLKKKMLKAEMMMAQNKAAKKERKPAPRKIPVKKSVSNLALLDWKSVENAHKQYSHVHI